MIRTFVSILFMALFLVSASTTHASEDDTSIHILIRNIPDSFDTSKSKTIYENTILADLFMGLLSFDKAGELIPGVADTWTISQDQHTYTFHIRNTAQWSDGTPITAQDFVYAFTRLFALGTDAPQAFAYHRIKGSALPRKAGDTTGLGVVAKNKNTLQITLTTPDPFFLRLLAHINAAPLPKHAIDALGEAWSTPKNLICNGPFRIKSLISQKQLVLEKNPYFYEKYLIPEEEIQYHVPDDENNPCRMAQMNQIDIAFYLPAHQTAYAQQYMAQWLRTSPEFNTYWLSLNHRAPKFANKKVRRALYLAINREKIVESLGIGTLPAYGLVPLMDRRPLFAAPAEPFETRLAEAMLLMREAGYSPQNPLQITIMTTQAFVSNLITASIARNWQKIFVQTTMVTKSFPDILDSLKNGTFEVSRRSWSSRHPTPEYFLDIFNSKSQSNYARWNSKEFDRIMLAAENAPTADARSALHAQAEKILLDDIAILPIYHGAQQSLVSPRIQGWQDNQYGLHLSRWLSKTPQ